MKIDGDQYTAAILKWAEGEVTQVSTARPTLGRFLFTVTTGTAAVFAGLERLAGADQVRIAIIVAYVFLLIAAIIALTLAMPRVLNVSQEHDLFDMQASQVQGTREGAVAWLIVWLIAVVAYAVF